MNLRSSIFGGVSIGKDTSGYVIPSVKGLAVKVSEDRYVARENNQLVDVGGFIIDGGGKYVYRIPVRRDQVAAGDLLITSQDPFRALFVDAVEEDGTISGVDPSASVKVEYIRPDNLFNVKFFVKAISLIDGLGGGGANNLLMLLALGDDIGSLAGGGNGESEDGLTTLLLLQGLGGGAVDINNLLPLLLLRGSKGNFVENLLLLRALGVQPGNPGGVIGQAVQGQGGPLQDGGGVVQGAQDQVVPPPRDGG